MRKPDHETYRTATQWGVYDVTVIDGEMTAVQGIEQDPNPSPIGEALIDTTVHATRIARPAIRRGWLAQPDRNRQLRGVDEFLDVPWDEALELAAHEIDRVRRECGNKAIFAGSYGWASAGRFNHAQSQLHRFINLIGGSTRGAGTYSTGAAQAILPHVVAPWHQMELEQTTWADITQHTQVMLAFGGLPLRNTQVAYGGITEHHTRQGMQRAVRNGTQFISASPVAQDTPKWLQADWISLRPGTDVALMLGIAYVLETQGLTDREFLASHCVGYPQFRAYLVGETDGVPKDPRWASAITDIDATVIQELARTLAGKRSFVTAAWSLQRAHHGEQPYWMVVTLAAMLGQVGLPGGGFGFGYAAEGHIGSDWRRFHWATHSKGRNPTGFAIPVARIADMLLNPDTEFDFNGHRYTYPDIEMIYWAGGNPFHHHQDLNRLIAGWRKPATVIVNEPWWAPTAQWADIVFPATTALEREDICASSHDPYAHVMERVVPIQNEARPDFEIFAGLARQLGVEEQFTEGRTQRQWLQQMWARSDAVAREQGFELPAFDEFWKNKTYRIPDGEPRPGWLSQFRQDAAKHPLNTPSGKLELFSSTIAAFDYADCPGHAAWIEPAEWLGAKSARRFPLHLLSPQPARRLHSQLDQSNYSQQGKIQGKEVLTVHPDTAASRGILAGDVVKVFNERGACLAGVELDDKLRPDVVTLPTGAWLKIDQDSGIEINGNPNVLTLDIGSSKLGQACSANTCLVEVERYDL